MVISPIQQNKFIMDYLSNLIPLNFYLFQVSIIYIKFFRKCTYVNKIQDIYIYVNKSAYKKRQ